MGPAQRPPARRPARGARRGGEGGRGRDLDGLPIAVSGEDDEKIVLIWDLHAGRQHGSKLKGHSDDVLAVAVGDLDGRPIAITGSDDATVRVWDLRADRQPAK